MRDCVLPFLLLWFIASCSGKDKMPDDILPAPRMQEVLWDMVSAGEFLAGYVLNKDSVDRFAESSKLYGDVLRFHKISREQFDRSYLYYRQHPALMKIILDTLIRRQLKPEELYKPKGDTLRKHDSVMKPVDTLPMNRPLKKKTRKLMKRKTDSIRSYKGELP